MTIAAGTIRPWWPPEVVTVVSGWVTGRAGRLRSTTISGGNGQPVVLPGGPGRRTARPADAASVRQVPPAGTISGGQASALVAVAVWVVSGMSAGHVADTGRRSKVLPGRLHGDRPGVLGQARPRSARGSSSASARAAGRRSGCPGRPSRSPRPRERGRLHDRVAARRVRAPVQVLRAVAAHVGAGPLPPLHRADLLARRPGTTPRAAATGPSPGPGPGLASQYARYSRSLLCGAAQRHARPGRASSSAR